MIIMAAIAAAVLVAYRIGLRWQKRSRERRNVRAAYEMLRGMGRV